MFMFFRSERPTSATLRLFAIATSAACCMRWMFEAKLATRMRPVRTGISWRNASPTSRSEPVMPGRSAFVESPSIRSMPRLPSEASLPTSVLSPSTGVWSSFQSPVWRTRPAGVSTTIATQSGIECAMRTNSSLNGPICDPVAVRVGLAQGRRRAEAVLVELRLDHGERQLGADHIARLDLAQHVRQRADVILVAVREDDREQRPVLEVGEVRQDEIDAEVLVPREREACVDQDALPVELVQGHVLADLAEPAERDDAERVAHRCEPEGWLDHRGPVYGRIRRTGSARPRRRTAVTCDAALIA